MRLEEFNKKLPLFLDTVFANSQKSIERAAAITMSQTSTRIIETGKNAQGAAFEDYTPSYKTLKQDVGRYRGHVDFVLGSYSINKRVAAIEKRALKKNPENDIELAAQKKARKTKLQQTKLATTAQLWNDVKLQKSENTGKEIRVSFYPTAKLNQDKLSSFVKKRGDILTPSAKEAELGGTYLDDSIQTIANAFFS